MAKNNFTRAMYFAGVSVETAGEFHAKWKEVWQGGKS
jgi:hypothetical protein